MCIGKHNAVKDITDNMQIILCAIQIFSLPSIH